MAGVTAGYDKKKNLMFYVPHKQSFGYLKETLKRIAALIVSSAYPTHCSSAHISWLSMLTIIKEKHRSS